MPEFTTAYRLKQIIKERGIKQTDIIKAAKPYCDLYKVKLGRNDLSQYLSGKVEPRQNKLYILAKTLNVSEAWLMGYDVSRKRPDTDETDSIPEIPNIFIPEFKTVPLLGQIACGEPILAEENIIDHVRVESNVKCDFALLCKGDSMINARIFDGDVVFIRKQQDVENGEIAAVVINDEATLKRVYKYENRLELRAENPTFQSINIEGKDLETVRIIGKAVAFTSYVK